MPPIGMQMGPVNEEKEEEEVATTKPVIGIIYPPPEVRNIVDKTASFVARNGPEFESRIRSNEINNTKFNFLTQDDPYHAYYQHKVKEFKEGKGQEPAAPKPGIPLGLAQKTILEQARIIEPIVPKEAPAEFEFIADPPSISAFELDIVKLTAQFVARNGRQFLTNLMNREQRNYQFDFLRPQHSLFTYFTKLVEQYTKILIHPKDVLSKLQKEVEEPKNVMEQVRYRVEWLKLKEREKQKEEEALEKERVSYAQIDWHDFVVVETVDFQSSETGNLPPPTTPDEVGARMLRQERGEKGTDHDEMELGSDEEETDEDDGSDEENEKEIKEKKPAPPKSTMMEMDNSDKSSDEDGDVSGEKKDDTPALPPLPPLPSDLPPLPPTPGDVIIKKDYDPKAKAITAAPEVLGDSFMISPITGEKIPVDKVPEHIRIGLLDPKWIEQRNRAMDEKKEQEDVYAPGGSIEKSLKMLAERRTDIFGVGVEETQIGKKIGEEEKKDRKIVWDGHTASMEKVTQKARENISIEEQIAVIHKSKGLVQDEEKEKIGPSVPKSGSRDMPPLPPPLKSMAPRPVAPPPPPPPSLAKPPPPKPMSMPPAPPLMQQQIRPGGVMMMPHTPVPPPPRSLLGQPPMPRPPLPPPPGGLSMGGRQQSQPIIVEKDDEPPAKKAKTEESLMPEEEFLRKNKSPVMFKVAVPNIPDKSEWKLSGQLLNFTLPLTDAVSVIKAKIHEAVGMPAGKQKLQYDGLFTKDSNTLAFYNITPRSVVTLQLKERGGRKK